MISSFGAGRRLRHHRPHRRAAHAGEARPDRGGREPARRRRPARQRGGRQFAEGRLHARRPDRGPDHRLGHDQAGALRRGRVRSTGSARSRPQACSSWCGRIRPTRTSSRWSRRPRPNPARSCSPARATARRSTSPPSCSSRSPASNMLHVPYRTSPEALAALLSKNVDVLFDTMTALLGQVESGQVRALGGDRQGSLPGGAEHPAAIEVRRACRATTSPPGTACTDPRACRSRWSPSSTRRSTRCWRSPTIRERLVKAGVMVKSSTPEAFAAVHGVRVRQVVQGARRRQSRAALRPDAPHPDLRGSPALRTRHSAERAGRAGGGFLQGQGTHHPDRLRRRRRL